MNLPDLVSIGGGIFGLIQGHKLLRANNREENQKKMVCGYFLFFLGVFMAFVWGLGLIFPGDLANSMKAAHNLAALIILSAYVGVVVFRGG